MSSSSDDPPLHPTTLEALEQSCQEVSLGLELANQKIYRLLATAFENPLKAEQALKACLRGVGVDSTLNILAGRGLLPRNFYFGLTRGSFFARGDQVRADHALEELPEAIREREVLSLKRDDLMNTRRVLMEREAARDPFVPDPGRGGNGGGRSRTR